MSHFIEALRTIDGGTALASADDQLTEVLEAVRRTGKKGEVGVKIVVAPNGERGFEVTTNITAKAPQLSFGKAFFFRDRNGYLTRKPPEEESANMLRAVDSGKGDK